MHLSTLRVPIDFGIDLSWSSVSFLISNLFFFCYQILSPLFICVVLYVFIVTIARACSIPHMAPHICWFLCTQTVSRHGPWNSLVVYLSEIIGVRSVIDSAIGTGFYKLLACFAILYTPHMPKFYMPTFGKLNAKTTVKQHPLANISFDVHQFRWHFSIVFSVVNTCVTRHT